MVRGEGLFGLSRVLPRRGDGIEDDGDGLAGGVQEAERIGDRLQIDDGGPAGDEDQVGRPGGFERRTVGMGRGVKVEHLASGLAHAADFIMQAPGVSRQYDRQLGAAAVGPVGRRCLGIEVDHGRVAPGRGGSDSEVQGLGGFPGTAFLADDCNGFHERIVNVCTCEHVHISSVHEITICVKAKRTDRHSYRGYSAAPGECAP